MGGYQSIAMLVLLLIYKQTSLRRLKRYLVDRVYSFLVSEAREAQVEEPAQDGLNLAQMIAKVIPGKKESE